jgi:hypothetical protein
VSVHPRNRLALPYALLALILLVVQTGALLHGYSHQDPGRRDGAAGAEQCLYCKAAAPLLGAAGTPAPLTLLLTVALVLLVQWPLPPRLPAFQHPAFRSRAPPRHS